MKLSSPLGLHQWPQVKQLKLARLKIKKKEKERESLYPHCPHIPSALPWTQKEKRTIDKEGEGDYSRPEQLCYNSSVVLVPSI